MYRTGTPAPGFSLIGTSERVLAGRFARAIRNRNLLNAEIATREIGELSSSRPPRAEGRASSGQTSVRF